MQDQSQADKRATSKSGVLRRPTIEPEHHPDPPRPYRLPEQRDEEGATTGAVPVVNEGEDLRAERDDEAHSHR